MSQAPIKQDRFEAIEAFVLGTMDAGQRQAFLREVEGDSALREELEMQREHILAVEMAGMERTLQEVMAGPADQVDRNGKGWRGWLKYAAMVAMLALGALWWFRTPAGNERLFAEYYTADPGLPVPMSATKDPLFQDAMVAFKLGDLEEAAAKWGSLLLQNPANDTLLYYIAQARLQMGAPVAALPGLQAVAGNHASEFRGKAKWYLFLAYLKLGDRAAMDALGLDRDTVYGEQVRQIQARVNE